MRPKIALLATAALFLGTFPAMAHVPPLPNPGCSDGTDGLGHPLPHDFVGAASLTVTTGITGEFGGGITVVVDGSLLPCGTEDFCPSGEDFLTIDPSGDDLPDGTDPSGDNVVIPCDGLPGGLGGAQVPIGDGEFEWGAGGAFFPATHHDPIVTGYHVDALDTDGGFVFGSDADGDGDVEEGSGDCFESHGSAIGNPSAPEFTTQCPSGGDGGWWLFTKCNATTLTDWVFTTNGALLRLGLGDDDGDDIPHSLDDDDSDGVPNGLEDADGDGVPDTVNGAWNPTLAPGSIPPDLNTSCLAAGHAGTFQTTIVPPSPCADGVDNDGDGATDGGDSACGPGSTGETECRNSIDDDGDGATDSSDSGCFPFADDDESSFLRVDVDLDGEAESVKFVEGDNDGVNDSASRDTDNDGDVDEVVVEQPPL